MKKRLLFYQLNKHINHKNALVITGMRQVGKTTLMKQLFDRIQNQAKLWFDFDNPLDQKVFEDLEYRNIYQTLQSLARAKKRGRMFVFIDEIQNFPEITKIIKYLIDHYQIKFIVTGSSSFYLKNLFPESLSGRKFLYNLAPLSFQEYLYFKDKISLPQAQKYSLKNALKPRTVVEFKGIERYYDDYLNFGGFPEVVVTLEPEIKKEILKNIFTSFFEKDLKILSDYQDIRELRDLILLLVPRIGSMLDVSRLASELGATRVKIYNYLIFLQGVFFIKLLPKFSKSIDRAVAGGKKVFFSDTGLLNIIGQVNQGQLLENAVVNQLALYGDLSFYNKRNTAEIDLILNKKQGFEVKLQGSVYDVDRLAKLAKKIGLDSYFVISRAYTKDSNIVFPGFL